MGTCILGAFRRELGNGGISSTDCGNEVGVMGNPVTGTRALTGCQLNNQLQAQRFASGCGLVLSHSHATGTAVFVPGKTPLVGNLVKYSSTRGACTARCLQQASHHELCDKSSGQSCCKSICSPGICSNGGNWGVRPGAL